MTEDGKPRKLRFLVRGKEKVDSLFRRRKKAKKTGGNHQHPDEDDFEDVDPILSRIADPTVSQPSKLKLKANDLTSTTGDHAVRSPQGEEDEEMQIEQGAEDHEQAVTTKRRQGTVGVGHPKGSQQFNTKTIVASDRIIAKQTSPESQPQPFAFTDHDQATTNSLPTFGPQAQIQRTESQIQQAARDVFLESKPKRDHVPDEHFASTKDGMTINQFLEDEDQNTSKWKHLRPKTSKPANPRVAPTSNTSVQPLSPHQPQPAPGLLDHLELNSKQRISPLRLDTTSPIIKISNYIRPQVETPEPAPALYRSSHHNPVIPHHILTNTIPDRIESLLFIQDIEDDTTSPRKTAFGDIPALDHEKRERVPLGARIKHDEEGNVEFTHLEYSLPKPKPLPRHLRGMTDQTRSDESRVPQTFYTAPNRLSNAYLHARRNINLKRKRLSPSSLPPPSCIYVHTGLPTFNVFTNGILLYPELCLILASQLPIQSLINLYSISKDFHVIVNQRFTTVISNQLRVKAPHAARCYPWRCYERLCQADPALRAGTKSLTSYVNRSGVSYGGTNVNIKPAPPLEHAALGGNTNSDPKTNTAATDPIASTHPYPTNHPTTELPPVYRKVPTFRYLNLAIHREKTIWQIYQLFAARGVPLPGHPSAPHTNSFVSTLHKLWFLMDIPDNPRRISYAHSPRLFTPTDLSNTLVFIVKLDMLLNDPVGGEKRDGARKLLLSASDGFDTLLRVLKRRDWVNEFDILRAWTRYGLQLDSEDGSERAVGGGWVPLDLSTEQHAQSTSVFGIPRAEVGLLKREFWGRLTYNTTRKERVVNGARVGWGRKPMFLIRPDQIVLREAVRRGLVFRKQFLRALLFGYVDEESEVFARLPVADYNGGRNPVLESEGEYEVDDVVAGVRALDVEEGGDQLLDLGDSKQGSPWTVKHYPPSKSEVDLRRQAMEGVQSFMEIWKEEIRKEREKRDILRSGFELPLQ